MNCCPPVLKTHRPLYRSRKGWIFGVAKGLANYADLPVFWIRLALVAALVFTGFFPVAFIYVLAAFLMKPEPVLPPQTDDDWEFYNSYTSSRAMAIGRLKNKLDQLERRTRRVESAVTARAFDWEHRLHSEA